MKRILRGLLLTVAAFAFAQQQPPYNSPPHGTPPTFPEGQGSGRGMPPETKAPPPRGTSSTQIQQHIQARLNSEPALANTNVNVKADDSSIVLSGTVDSVRQRDLALRITESYADGRRIVDKIEIKEQT